MLSLIKSGLSRPVSILFSFLVGCPLVWLDRPAFANTGHAADIGNKLINNGLITRGDTGQIMVKAFIFVYVGYFVAVSLIILPLAYWYFRTTPPRSNFFSWYWIGVKESFRWFKLTNILSIVFTAIWIGSAHKNIGESLGHSIPIVASIHMVIAAFEHHLRLFAETPERITDTIKEAIFDSIKDQRIYVSGLQTTGVDNVLEVIRHKETLKDSQHGFALMRFNADVVDYAEVCKECLKQSKKSVKSMSDFELDEGFPEFCTGKPALDWTERVNQKVLGNNTFKVQRIQVMTYARIELVKNLNLYIKSNADEDARRKILAYARVGTNGGEETKFLKDLQLGLGRYKNSYWKKDQNFSRNLLLRTSSELGKSFPPIAKCQEHDKLACGEFILFDDDVLIRYSPSSKLLEVLIGKPVKEFSETFSFLENNPVDWDFQSSRSFFSTG